MSEWLKHDHPQHSAEHMNYCSICTSSTDKHQYFITWRIIYNPFLWCLCFLIKLKAAVRNIFRWNLSLYIFAKSPCQTHCHLPFWKSHPVVSPAQRLLKWQSILNVSIHSIYVHLMIVTNNTNRCTLCSNLSELFCLCQQHATLISLI